MKDNSNISQELLETIERYYNNTMPQQERLDFELKMNEDSEFKAQVEDIKTLILGIKNQSLKEELDGFHEDLPIRKVKDKRRIGAFPHLGKYTAAAAILLAIALLWVYSVPQNERLYATYFTPDPGLPTVMSSNSNFEFYDAMVNYKQGDYTVAITKWKSIDRKGDTLNYFLGVAYLANKNENKAIKFLEKATQNSDFVLSNEAYYYLGLAHLKQGNIEQAKISLAHSNVENSKALLSKLNQ